MFFDVICMCWDTRRTSSSCMQLFTVTHPNGVQVVLLVQVHTLLNLANRAAAFAEM